VLWVTLPEDADVDALFDAANERGVAFVKGSDFLLEGGGNTLRLAYSGVTADRIDGGHRPARRRLPLDQRGAGAGVVSGRRRGRGRRCPRARVRP